MKSFYINARVYFLEYSSFMQAVRAYITVEWKTFLKNPDKTEMIHRLVVYNIFNRLTKNSEESGKKLNGMKN